MCAVQLVPCQAHVWVSWGVNWRNKKSSRCRFLFEGNVETKVTCVAVGVGAGDDNGAGPVCMSSFLAGLAWADERLFCLAYCLDKCESDGVFNKYSKIARQQWPF